ncbi:MAG: phage portal protein [Pseudomonadota bacterium]|nr:phage portal protein [Pseudomonadota bacterium]
MGLFDLFRTAKSEPAAQLRPETAQVAAQSNGGPTFFSFDSDELHDYMRGGETASGEYVNAKSAMNNMALLRCVSLISESIGMLPLNLTLRGDEKAYASAHPLYQVLKNRPNEFQGPYKFKSTMQLRALMHGNAYARVVWRGNTVVRLIPLDSRKVTPKMNDDFTVRYEVQRPDGGMLTLAARDILHIADLSEDEHGLVGLSRVLKAKETLGLASQAQKAAARIFRNGVMAGGALMHPQKLNEEQIGNIQTSLEGRYSGSDNAHKWLVLEDGMKAEKWAATAKDSQMDENRDHQIEEIARAFGVPRPLLMMGDTSWGSGIEQLGIFFVQYGLQHWFEIWEDAIENTLMSAQERSTMYVKFNERALLRGTLKDQADFYAKALGSGGSAPWMKPNEVRDLQELPKSDEPVAESLQSTMTRNTNVPAPTP